MAKEMKSNFGPARSKPAGKAGSVIGTKHALKKYDYFALNTSCFWGICAIS